MVCTARGRSVLSVRNCDALVLSNGY